MSSTGTRKKNISSTLFLENAEKNLKSIKNDSHAFFICMNTIENLNKLLELWNKFITYNHLGLIFLNPFSKAEKSWTIFPHTHDLISDESSLKLGIQTMFGQVEPTDRKDIEKIYENQ